MSQLIAERLSKSFPTAGEPLAVLHEVSLELQGTENLAIVGPSGSGKSSLLHILGALDPPTTGRVTLDGVDPFQFDEPSLAEFRGARIGFIFQEHHLLPQCTVLENVLVPTLAQGRTQAAELARAHELLERVGLGPRLDHRPAQLSGGERQRTAVARALIRQPALVLADEPTGNLDATSAETVIDLLLELQTADPEIILIVVTHSDRLAQRMQRRWTLEDGRLVTSTLS